MNNYVFFIFTLILFILLFNVYKNSLLSPPVIFTAGFLISSFMFVCNTHIWNYVLDGSTVVYMIVGMLSFIFGCIVCYKKITIPDNIIGGKIIQIRPKYLIAVFFVIEVVGIGLRFLVLSYSLGSMSLENEALGEYRMAHQDTPYDLALKFIVPIISAITIYAIANLLSMKVNQKKLSLSSILLIIGYFIFSTLSSARIEIIYLFVYFIVYYVIVSLGDKRRNISRKTLSTVVLVFTSFFAVFFLLGYLTGKSQQQTSFFDNISIYTCSSLGALCEYMKSYSFNPADMFTDSMRGIYNILSYIGINIERISKTPPVGFVQFGNMTHTTNVYTCFHTPIHDFGYVGSCIVMFFQGVFYQKIYNTAKEKLRKNNNRWLFIYIYMCPMILISSISERFSNSVLTITTIVFWFAIKFINKSIRSYK